MNSRLSISLAGVAVFAALGHGANAGVIFSEDFESYAAGSNLSGQGGWTGDALKIDASAGLGSKAAVGTQGATFSGTAGRFTITSHALPAFSSTQVYTLASDEYAVPRSNASSIYFSSGGTVTLAGWQSDFTNGWAFDGRGLTGGGIGDVLYFSPFVSGVNIKFEVIVDPANLALFGRANFGNGVVETKHLVLDPNLFAKIDGIMIIEDFRGTLGVDIDNITVSTPDPTGGVPEPASLALLAAGFLGFGLRRRYYS